MRKRTFVVALSLVGVLILAMLVLRSFQLDIIHSIVVGAMLEKSEAAAAPRIRANFDQARARALREGTGDAYLRRLLEISQRLEKMPSVDADQLDEILRSLEE